MSLFLIGPLVVAIEEVVDEAVAFTMLNGDLLILMRCSMVAWSGDVKMEEAAAVCCADEVSDSEGGAPIRKDDDEGIGEESVDWLGLLKCIYILFIVFIFLTKNLNIYPVLAKFAKYLNIKRLICFSWVV